MPNNSAEQKQMDTAQSIQVQFRFYVISLIFTLLAASVQTAKFGNSKFENSAEVIAWLLLLASGLLSLWYFEWEPVLRYRISHKLGYEQRIRDTKQAKLQGKDQVYNLHDETLQPLQEQLSNLVDSQISLQTNVDLLEKKMASRYDFAKYCFIAGLVFILVARGSSAVVWLFGYKLI